MPFAAVEVGEAVRRGVPACVTTYGGRRLRAGFRSSSACKLTSEAAAGHRSLSGEGFPVRALRSLALALNVGLVHASQRLQVGNHYYLGALRLRATFILLPTRPPDQRAGQ